MPSLTLEYTDNLPLFRPADALTELTRILVESGEFREEAIKGRAIRLDTFRVGTSPEGRGFVYARLAILSGRSDETKRRVAESLVAALRRAFEWPVDTEVQLCAEIVDIHRESYTKAIVGG